MTKMTYVQAIDNAIALFSQGGQVDAEDKATVEKLEALKVQLNKRNSTERKPTKAQAENEAIKADILAVLTDGVARTVTEVMAEVPALTSNQKASALMTQLKEGGLVTRELIKHKAYFKVA